MLDDGLAVVAAQESGVAFGFNGDWRSTDDGVSIEIQLKAGFEGPGLRTGAVEEGRGRLPDPVGIECPGVELIGVLVAPEDLVAGGDGFGGEHLPLRIGIANVGTPGRAYRLLTPVMLHQGLVLKPLQQGHGAIVFHNGHGVIIQDCDRCLMAQNAGTNQVRDRKRETTIFLVLPIAKDMYADGFSDFTRRKYKSARLFAVVQAGLRRAIGSRVAEAYLLTAWIGERNFNIHRGTRIIALAYNLIGNNREWLLPLRCRPLRCCLPCLRRPIRHAVPGSVRPLAACQPCFIPPRMDCIPEVVDKIVFRSLVEDIFAGVGCKKGVAKRIAFLPGLRVGDAELFIGLIKQCLPCMRTV